MNPWRQRLKWAVYAILFADFLVYLYQDVTNAQYTLDADSNLREVLAAYVTSIDLVAWFALILLFELETGVRVGREWTGAARWVVRTLRIVCYVAILHTSFASVIALREFQNPQQLPVANDVCDYAGEWTLPAQPRLPGNRRWQLHDDRSRPAILRPERRQCANGPGGPH